MSTKKRRGPGRPRAAEGTTKRSTNLSLDPDALARAQEYARQHGTNLSRLVSDLLRDLPLEAAYTPSSPIVRRLSGVARGGDGREAHREHLARKHGVA
jgi:Family of unknown function (DUF6364)